LVTTMGVQIQGRRTAAFGHTELIISSSGPNKTAE
jgi:hypothetical protein